MRYYATLGPSCQDEQTIYDLFCVGMTGARLNASHVSLKDSGPVLRAFQDAAARASVEPELILDLQGPEIRVGYLPQSITLQENATALLGEGGLPVPKAFLHAIREGVEILIDDGALLLKAETCGEAQATCRVLRGGRISSYKSVALPGFAVELPPLTDADRENLSLAAQYPVKAVLQPFVRGKDDVAALRGALHANGLSCVRIIAKIENRRGVENLPEIMECADEICIARGDLGNDLPLGLLPETQKRIAAACIEKNVPFMVVTQLLHSMIASAVPTRAEVSDIFNAVLDGASSLLLTGETATGKYPVEAARYLRKTGERAQAYLRSL